MALKINSEVETIFGLKIKTGTVVTYSHTTSVDGTGIATLFFFWNSIDDFKNNRTPLMPNQVTAMKQSSTGPFVSKLKDGRPEFNSLIELWDALAAMVLLEHSDFNKKDVLMIGTI